MLFNIAVVMYIVCCSDYLFKLLLIGDSGVGKSCLLLRFAVSIIVIIIIIVIFIIAIC